MFDCLTRGDLLLRRTPIDGGGKARGDSPFTVSLHFVAIYYSG